MASIGSVLLSVVITGTPAGLAELSLQDQLGRSHSLAEQRGRVVVAMVVTAKRLRNLKAWEEDLRARFDGLDYLRIADIPSEPPVTYRQVADKLSRRVPEDVSVLVDLEGRWAADLGLDTSRPNLLLFDRDGRLRARYHGRRSPELLEEVVAAIEDVLELQ